MSQNAQVFFVKRFAHPSLLIFALAATLTLSAALLVGRVVQEQGVKVQIEDLQCK